MDSDVMLKEKHDVAKMAELSVLMLLDVGLFPVHLVRRQYKTSNENISETSYCYVPSIFHLFLLTHPVYKVHYLPRDKIN